MKFLKGVSARVSGGGQQYPFNSIEVSQQLSRLGKQWRVTFPKAMAINPSTLWTIDLNFAGASGSLVSGALAEEFDGSDIVPSSTSSISSQSLFLSENMDVLNNYGIPKALVFINRAWLSKVEPRAYIDQNGAVMVNTDSKNSSGGTSTSATRFFHERLPGKDQDPLINGKYNFECRYATTHQDIAYKLCEMIGVDLKVNTPDMPIIDTCTFASGTKWFDCIKKNFLIWSPYIDVYYDSSGKATVVIEDCLAGNSRDSGHAQNISVTSGILSSIQRRMVRPSDERLVDHVIVLGRKTQDTQITVDNRADYTITSVTPTHFKPTVCYMVGYSGSSMAGSVLNQFDGDFEQGDDKWTPKKPDTTHSICYHEYMDGQHFRRIPVSEMIQSSDSDGIVSLIATQHWYSPDKQKIVETVENTFFRYNNPGCDDATLRLIQTKTSDQTHVAQPLNVTLTSETVQAKIIYEKNVQQQSGQPVTVNSNPKKLLDALSSNPNYVDKKPGTTQVIDDLVVSYRFNRIDRADPKTLMKTEVSFEVLSKGAPQVHSQVLDNPERETTITTDTTFRREYQDPSSSGVTISGHGPYFHPARTIQHDDITNDTQASAIAQRIWYRKNAVQSNILWEFTIDILVPVFLNVLGGKCTVPSLSRKFTGSSVSVPGGTYYITRNSYKLDQSNDQLRFKQSLGLASQI